MSREPDLSVVVTVVSGAESARRTLLALCPEGRSPDGVEILVPIERGRDDVAVLGVEFDDVRFLDLGDFALETMKPGPAAEHERYDRRRAAGLLFAKGSLIAVVEDHGTPAPGFCDRVRAAHSGRTEAAIGGVVCGGVDRAVHDALWLLDFGRYAPPREAGPAEALTDVCVSYRRAALNEIRHVWAERFHEPEVHAALIARGGSLRLDPTLVVTQERPSAPFGDRLAERVAWGRLFGVLRGRTQPPGLRGLSATASLLIVPWLLTLRAFRGSAGRLSLGRRLRCLPALFVLAAAWCVGEALGTLRCGSPKRR